MAFATSIKNSTLKRASIPRMAKYNALLKLPYLNSGNGKTTKDSDEEVLNFFGCYSDSKIDEAINKMQSDDSYYGVKRNHPFSQRLEQLRNQTFAYDISVRISKIHGFGVFSSERIEKDEIILEYIGDVITKQESDEREMKYRAQGMEESYFAKLDDCYVVDSTNTNSIARYVNHSCNPNSVLEVLKIEGVKTIVMSAKRLIKPNVELTYDYKFLDENSRVPCLCKSAKCRGFINQI